MELRKIAEKKLLREVTVKIGLEIIDIQKGVIIEVLLDSSVIKFVISLEFSRKQRFKLKKIERSIYIVVTITNQDCYEFKTRVKSEEQPQIGLITKELNRKLCIGLSTLYIQTNCCSNHSSLKDK